MVYDTTISEFAKVSSILQEVRWSWNPIRSKYTTPQAYFHQLNVAKTTQCIGFHLNMENSHAFQPEVK